MMIQVETGVLMPPRNGAHCRRGSGYSEAFRHMEVGQSLIYRSRSDSLAAAQRNALRMARVAAPNWKFASRTMQEGGERIVRIWRVA